MSQIMAIPGFVARARAVAPHRLGHCRCPVSIFTVSVQKRPALIPKTLVFGSGLAHELLHALGQVSSFLCALLSLPIK